MNRIRLLVLAIGLAAGLLACSDQALQPPAAVDADLLASAPSPSLAPGEVVRIQLDALRQNDRLPGESGIRLAFRFASPENQASTGPVERFIALVRGPQFQSMLNHRAAELGEVVMHGERAMQRVTLTTLDYRSVSYLFVLRRAELDGCAEGCWVTDAVHPWPGTPREPPRRVNV